MASRLIEFRKVILRWRGQGTFELWTDYPTPPLAVQRTITMANTTGTKVDSFQLDSPDIVRAVTWKYHFIAASGQLLIPEGGEIEARTIPLCLINNETWESPVMSLNG